MAQHIRPHDWCSVPLLRYLYALCLCRYAEELPTVCVSFCEFWRSDYARVSVLAILEVSYISLLEFVGVQEVGMPEALGANIFSLWGSP